MRLACLFTACALLVGCSPDEPAPRDSGTAPAISADEARALEEAREHFLGLDFDGRFGWYRREVIGTDEEALWGAWLAERGEAEFLEAVALCRAGRWKLYGRALYELDDPRWVRLAAWCLDSTTPADAAAARAALLSRKGLALDWLDLHVEQLAPTEAALHAQLVAEAPEREDAGALPAPLSEAVVYGGLLREAREVQSGTATPAPTEEQPARGDALRGILALQCSSRRSDLVLDALAQVARHPDATLAMAVANASTRLERVEVPTSALLSVVRDDERPLALREAALDAIANGPRYAAYIEYCKLAWSPRDPLWPAAVRHLGEIGDRFAVACLEQLTDEELEEPQRALKDDVLATIRGRGELGDEDFLAQLTDYMERITYADLAGGAIRDQALAEMRVELCDRLHNYELKYKLKEIMVQYEAPARLVVGLDADLWTARLREHCRDAISCW